MKTEPEVRFLHAYIRWFWGLGGERNKTGKEKTEKPIKCLIKVTV